MSKDCDGVGCCRLSNECDGLIKDTNYERIYEINSQLEERPNLGSHYLGVYGTEPQF